MTRVGRRSPPQRPISAADLRRSQIVDRAAELFDSAGYDRTSMDGIAKAVDMAKPTLYHYFKGKDEILYWIHEEFIDLLMRQHDDRADLNLTAGQELRQMMADILSLMQTHRGHVRVFFEHHRELSPARREIIERKRTQYQDVMSRVLADGMATGEFRAVDPKLSALAIFGMCNWAYTWYSAGGQLPAREIATIFADLLHHGLKGPA